MMDKSFIEKIVELGGVEQVVVGGREYTTKGLHPVYRPTARTVGAHTLSGLVDFVRASEASLWPGSMLTISTSICMNLVVIISTSVIVVRSQ